MKKESGSPRTSTLVDRIESVNNPDDYTVVFKLKKIVASFLVSDAIYRIVPEHILGSVAPDQIKSHPLSTGDPAQTIGTGPFKFKEWVKDDHQTVVKNPDYFLGAPALDEYLFKVVKDSSVVVSQLRTGEADYGSIQKSFFEEMSKQQNVTALAYDSYSFTYYAYQNDASKTDLFQDKRVRQALAYAVDRDAVVKAIYFGLGKIGQGTMPTLSWAYQPDKIKTQYKYDPKKAEQLLDEAGWAKGSDGVRAKDGKRLAFTLWTNAGNVERGQYVTVLQQMWRAIGVDATPKTEEWSAYLARLDRHDFEMYLVGFSWGVDPDQSTFWSCNAYEGGFNDFKYCNKRVDELLDQGLAELDQEKRKQIYLEFQDIVTDEVPAVVLDFPQTTVALNKRVKNMFPGAINRTWNAHTWFVTDGR
jgi:peptide/nickel transport system substrate-binding protein